MLSETPLLLDTSEDRPVFLIKGENGAYIRLSPSAYHLYAWVKEGKSPDQIATLLEGEGRGYVSQDEVAEACSKVIENVHRIETKKLGPGRGFLFHLPLLKASWVASLSRPLASLFNPLVVVVAILLFAACFGAAWGRWPPAHMDAPRQGVAFGLLFLSLLVHELGHASACLRYGEPPSHIGLTLYLVFPAFYADVTGAWRLSRWQRVVVDLGGIYFQAFMGGLFSVIFLATGSSTMRLAAMLLAGSIFFQLNPIFRFDGYWLIADGLGVSNLGAQPWRIFRHLAYRLRGKCVQPLPWNTWTLVALSIYSIVSLVVWTYFYWRVWPAIRFYLVQYPHNLHLLWTSGLQQVGFVKAFLSTLLTAIPLVLLVYFLLRTLSPLKQVVRRIGNSTKKSPRTLEDSIRST